MATQQERRTGTRRAIVEAAFAAYQRVGSPEVPLETIAGKAGVTKATIHYHFRNRSGLMRAVAIWLFRRIELKVDRAKGRRNESPAARYVRALLSEQATPAGRVLFTLGDELARSGDLGDIDPYQYLVTRLGGFGVSKSPSVTAAAITQYGRQLAYGLMPVSEINAVVKALVQDGRLH